MTTMATQEKSEEKPRRKEHTAARKIMVCAAVAVVVLFLLPMRASAASVDVKVNGGSGASTVEIVETMTMLALLPFLLIMTTCFTRIIIVLSFLRNALGLQQTPPNQVLIGIALFLSLFVMSPVVSKINTEAYQPYKQEKITQEEFVHKACKPLKEFMLKNTKKDDLNLFVGLAKIKSSTSPENLSITVVIPAFISSELKRAFTIGFLIFLPFLVIDLIVSSTLMSMGMIMLPPAMISLPFKLLLFVLVDGWDLLFKTLATSFNL